MPKLWLFLEKRKFARADGVTRTDREFDRWGSLGGFTYVFPLVKPEEVAHQAIVTRSPLLETSRR